MNNTESLVLGTISSDAYLSINKNLIRNIGINEAIMISDLISRYKYFKGKGSLIDEEWFFNIADKFEYDTGLSKYHQTKAIECLIQKKLIKTKLMGLPAKKYFKLRFETILKQVLEPIKSLMPDRLKAIYNKNNVNKNKEIINININKESESDSNPINKPKEKQESIEKELPKTIECSKSKRIINKWNSFEQTSTHKTDKPFSKTYLKLINDLSKLQKGTFFKNKIIDKDWIEQNNIPDSIFDKKWTAQELTITITNLSKYALEGYWPRTDKKNFKSLSNLLYNPISKKSWFLNAFVNPPELLKETIKNKPFETEYPKTQKIIQESSIWPKGQEFTPADERTIEKNIKSLKKFADCIVDDQKDTQAFANYWLGDLQKVVNEYLKWLNQDKQDWITKEPQIFGTDTKIFGRFIHNIEKEIKFKVKSKGWKNKN